MADSDNTSQDEATATAEVETKTYSEEAYKKLQTKLNSANNQKRTLARQVAELSTNSNAGATRIESALVGILDVLGTNEQFEGQKAQVATLKDDLGKQRTEDSTLASFSGEIHEILEAADSDADWNTDPDFAAAREAAQAGRREDAVRLTKAALQGDEGTYSMTDVQAMVQKALDERKDFNVDVGSSTANVGSTGRIRRNDVLDVDVSDTKGLKDHSKKVLDQYFSKK
jgi:hypothetical protein